MSIDKLLKYYQAADNASDYLKELCESELVYKRISDSSAMSITSYARKKLLERIPFPDPLNQENVEIREHTYECMHNHLFADLIQAIAACYCLRRIKPKSGFTIIDFNGDIEAKMRGHLDGEFSQTQNHSQSGSDTDGV